MLYAMGKAGMMGTAEESAKNIANSPFGMGGEAYTADQIKDAQANATTYGGFPAAQASSDSDDMSKQTDILIQIRDKIGTGPQAPGAPAKPRNNFVEQLTNGGM
jgi:hypothetical protein